MFIWGAIRINISLAPARLAFYGGELLHEPLYLKGCKPEWSNPKTPSIYLELESGLKCVSGQGEHSVFIKISCFPLGYTSLFNSFL